MGTIIGPGNYPSNGNRSREQIAQKFDKRARTRTFKCIRKATGSIVPLWSQGFRVCLATSCTDEPRIRLEKDDIIRVTGFRKHWLFGERVFTGPNSMEGRKRKGPVRGWFPRRCAIELIEPTSVDAEPDTTEILNFERHNSINDQIPKTQRNGYNRKKIN
ncbi:hypothetical protein GQX74_015215 [Glossina fuscipes]|nr:hypothetical protein GQX74_015215 [Glossina fuscipes]